MVDPTEAQQNLALAVIEQAIEDLGSADLDLAADAEDFLFQRIWSDDCLWIEFFDLNRAAAIPALEKLKVRLQERRDKRERIKIRNRLERLCGALSMPVEVQANG